MHAFIFPRLRGKNFISVIFDMDIICWPKTDIKTNIVVQT